MGSSLPPEAGGLSPGDRPLRVDGLHRHETRVDAHVPRENVSCLQQLESAPKFPP